MSVFLNRKPKLSGDPEDSEAVIDQEAVAGLTGSLVVENVNNVFGTSFDASSITNSITSTTGTIVSVTITPVNATNKVNVTARIEVVSGIGDAVIELREGSNVLDDETIPGGSVIQVITLTVDLDNVSVSSHTYTLRIRFVSGSFQYGDGRTFTANPAVIVPTIVAAVTDFLDTHDAEITTPATAIKNIISPDSHRTRGTEVIP